jgi:hypothetical protein
MFGVGVCFNCISSFSSFAAGQAQRPFALSASIVWQFLQGGTSVVKDPMSSTDPKPTFFQKVLDQFKEVFGMFLYLWVLFALFTYYKSIVLAQHNILYKPFGVAFINAFILAKVMLGAEKLNLAEKLRGKPLAYPILSKSILLSVIFILFNMAETIAKGLWKGKSLMESMPKVGSGSPSEWIVTAMILAVALVPFFAFRELSRAVGRGVLGGLLIKGSAQRANPPNGPN